MSHIMRIARSRFLVLVVVVLLFGSVTLWAVLARQQKKEPPTPGPMLEQGYLDLDTPAFSLRLVRSSQTAAALKPKGAGDFDFTPGDLLVERSKDGYYHLGDIDLRLREGTAGEWKSYSTALSRKPVEALATSAQILAAANLASTLSSDIPLQITRTWALEDGKLTLRFVLKNKTAESVQIGALGIPMIFNNTDLRCWSCQTGRLLSRLTIPYSVHAVRPALRSSAI